MAKDSEWKGYSLHELRVRRMVALAKIEVQKNAMSHHVHAATHFGGFGGPIMQRITGALTYMDYAVLAFRVARNIFRFIKK